MTRKTTIPDPSLLFGNNDMIEKKRKKLILKTKSCSLNRALTVGGMPAGCLTEIHGTNQNGKSVLEAIILASACENNHLSAIIDSEHSVDFDWFENLGVDWQKTKYHDESFLEEVGKYINQLLDNFRKLKDKKLYPEETLLFIGLDTITTLILEDEETDYVIRGYSLKAKVISDILNRWLSKINNDVCVMIVNQERANIGHGRFESETKSYGGFAMQHNCATRIAMTGRYKERDKSDKASPITGYRLDFIVEKCKNVGINNQKGSIFISNGKGDCEKGFDEVKDAYHEAIYREYFKKEGTSVYVPYLDKSFRGQFEAIKFFRKNNDELIELKNTLDDQLLTLNAKKIQEDDEQDDNQEEEQEEKPRKKSVTSRRGQRKK